MDGVPKESLHLDPGDHLAAHIFSRARVFAGAISREAPEEKACSEVEVTFRWVWVKIDPREIGSGFSPWCHLLGFQFGYLFLTHSQMCFLDGNQPLQLHSHARFWEATLEPFRLKLEPSSAPRKFIPNSPERTPMLGACQKYVSHGQNSASLAIKDPY